MDSKDLSKFVNVLSGVFLTYSKDLSGIVSDVYFSALKKYDLDAVTKALSMHLQHPDKGQFLPKPADVVLMIEGTTGDNAMSVWSRVDKAVRSVGGGETIVFDDPVIHRVIDDMGGWIGLCGCDLNDYKFKAKEFETRYRGYYGKNPEYPKKLIGSYEQLNLSAGQRIAKPIVIGNVEKARLVYSKGVDEVNTFKELNFDEPVKKIGLD